ncbi:trifunctional purine biosynthetic protein adenosine-3-like [Discoglossus pictus]
MANRVLVVGSGSREQALAWKLAQSRHIKQVLVAPGNADFVDSGKISSSAVLISNPAILKQFCKDHNIGLAVISPITLLSTGLIDDLTATGVRCFGPTAGAAQLEANKSYAKDFMVHHGIPTARWKAFTNPHEACSFITYADFPALVVKASGLRTGRDLYICNDKDEACRAVQHLTQDRTIGPSTETFIVEERLQGEELYCLGFTDGTTLAPVPLIHVQAHKKNGDLSSEMPAVSRLSLATKLSEVPSKKIQDSILQQVVDALREEGCHYRGVLGARIMLTDRGPMVLGFKCSFQEFDSQVILPLLKNDFYEVIQAVIDGRLYFHHFEKYAAHYELDTSKYKNPTLVCTTNSAASKIQVAQMCNKHSAVAHDLVAVCMNNLLALGAHTLFFMPYLSCGLLDAGVAEAIFDGLVEACKMAGCTLLERKIAQVPDVYPPGSYMLSGCAVGIVERERKLPRLDEMTEGDLVIGVRSSAMHCSSVAYIRSIMEHKSFQYSSLLPVGNGDQTWGDLFLHSSNYSNILLPALQSGHVRACILVTEGGILGSILRGLPESFGIIIDALCWKVPDIFSWLYKEGGVSEEEMILNFNCGIGAILIVDKEAEEEILMNIQKREEAWLIGALAPHHTGSSQVQVRHLSDAMRINTFQLLKNVAMNRKLTNTVKVAVFISTTGTKLKLLIDTTRHPGSCARLSLVISNKAAVEELRKAAGVGIPTRVIDHTQFGCQSDFESTLSRILEEFSTDLICLAGFVRTLSDGFLLKWKGKLLILYPSLSPSFKMENVKHQVPQTGIRVTGCTICFMHDGAAPGPVVLQETLTLKTEDTEDFVNEQMEEAKQRAVAKAVQLVASGAVRLNENGGICWTFSD